jgi:hypothetical protein
MTHTIRTTAASVAALMLLSGPLVAQDRPIRGGTSGGVQGQGVSASTYGTGATDGTSIGVTGGGEAVAVDGRAATESSARLNERRAMQRSSAYARTDEEMARSRTRTVVRNGEDVRSRTTTMYRDRDGGPPVRTSECTRSTAEATVTTDCRGPN